ncbi:unnamed protein product, partial [Allacma fusca]
HKSYSLIEGLKGDASIIVLYGISWNRPLTRYLPVRGDEEQFDLRSFIESSGHQLELCPHVIVTATTARGFLSKLGSRFHNWNKRWFVFDRETRTLSYYIDKSEKKPRGGIHFQVGIVLPFFSLTLSLYCTLKASLLHYSILQRGFPRS